MDNNSLIDIFDKSGQICGYSSVQEAHRLGLSHKHYHLWIMDRNHQVWLRIIPQKGLPTIGKYTVTADGHIPRHWNEDRALAQLENSHALKINFLRVSKLFTEHLYADFNTVRENEIIPVYLLKTLQRMSDLMMPPEELDGIIAADIHGLIKLFNGDIPFLQSAGLIRDDRRHRYQMVSRKVMLKDFCEQPQDYYRRIFALIRQSIGNKSWLMDL